MVRYSCPLSAGVLHELQGLKVYSWCIHGERYTPYPPTPLPACSPPFPRGFIFTCFTFYTKTSGCFILCQVYYTHLSLHAQGDLYGVQADSAHCTISQLIQDEVLGWRRDFIWEAADQLYGRLAPQNNLLVGALLPGYLFHLYWSNKWSHHNVSKWSI